jgi:hypothetical protein
MFPELEIFVKLPALALPYVAFTGSVSVTIFSPLANVAPADPPFETVNVQVNAVPTIPASVVLFVFVTVKSAAFAVTVTVFEPVLLVSFPSVTRPSGSTVAVFARLPAAVGVALKLTVKFPSVSIVTELPLAVQVNIPVLIAQLLFPELVIFVKLPVLTLP